MGHLTIHKIRFRYFLRMCGPKKSHCSQITIRWCCGAGLGTIALESNQLYYITLENSPIILYYNYSNLFKVINYIILLFKM